MTTAVLLESELNEETYADLEQDTDENSSNSEDCCASGGGGN